MKYAGVIKNDIAAAPGVCVSFFTQGCPFHCEGCHNPESWDYNGGKEFTVDVLDDIIKSINANGVSRNFCVMGGEPLCPENLKLVDSVIMSVKSAYPEISIYVWTGYDYEKDLKDNNDVNLQSILNNIDCLIDGQFIIEKRDVSLFMRGSTNQHIIYLNKEGEKFGKNSD